MASSLLFVGEASAAHVSCGQTITTNTTLDGDIGPCSGTGIIVGANNITLDLNGYEVFGVAGVPGEGAGIHLVGRSGVQVIDGEVRHFDAGIAIQGGGGNRVQGVTADRNEGDSTTDFGDGIAIGASHNNIIKGNTVTRNAPYDGIGLFGSGGSDSNLIENNTVTDNFGTRTIGPHGPTEEDDGIRLENGSQFNVVRNNAVLRNGLDGIAVFFQSSSNVIRGNEVRDNGFHDRPDLNRLGDGIHVFLQANQNLIGQNEVTGNAVNGIVIDSQNNVIRGNDTGGNVEMDLQDNNANCDNNVWRNNTFVTADPPCTTL